MITALFHPFFAFLLVVLFTIPLRKVARISGIVDKPGGRKQHAKAIPPIGGLIIFSVFLIYGYVAGVVDLDRFWSLYTALIVLLVTGALDDQFYVPAWVKFAVHIIAALLVSFYGGVKAAYLGDLFGFGVVWTSFMAYPFTIIAIVLLINAINLMDGLDGLAGGAVLVMFSWFAFASFGTKWGYFTPVLLLLIGCLLGFLVFNMRNPWRRTASLFLGDAGSMSLGLMLAWFSVLLAKSPAAPLEPISVAWIIGFPIFDVCAQFNRRIREGKHPFSPDRGHFHHHFIDAGVPVHYAVPVILFIIFLMGLIGYGGLALGVPHVVLTLGWIVLLFTHIVLSAKPHRYIGFIQYCVHLIKLRTT